MFSIITHHNRGFSTAEPLDKKRLRIFQPTLRFLSAIGGKYGNCEQGYPQVLNGLVLKGFNMVRVLPIHFGVVLGCKGGGGKKETYFRSRIFFFFQVQLFQTELQARYSTMPGLEVYFSVFLGCKGGGGKKTTF